MNTFSDPIKIIEQITFSDDAHIADFGCGSGAYSLAIAKKLIMGKIFAIDVRKDMVERLGNIAKSEKIEKLHVVWGDIDEENGSRLRENSIDFVLLTNTLFQVEDKKMVMQEASRILKSGGRLLIIDWEDSFGNIGPKEDHIITERTAKLLTEEVGFIFDKKIEAGEHHYGFIVHKL
ncbi:MAG: class I SAM-dependent methyltransferase [Candidatus Pacebacteria bacterium]|nr:class I SAM-dependent methyltransferase [Candidatus Paceibacterota bacterium]